MLTKRIIPCLDVDGGRVVKGVKFANLVDAGCPIDCAIHYRDTGADELVILDISATPSGRETAASTVASVRAVLDIPLTVGGGVRSVRDAERLLNAGADKVAINSAAVAHPDLINAMAEAFGSQCTVVAVDASATPSATWEVRTTSGRDRPGLDAIEWVREAADRGAGEILLTSWDQDGTREGYDCRLLAAASKAAPIPVIASGGANGAADMVDAFRAGAAAVLAASIFHSRETTVRDIKHILSRSGIEVRP
ncbi:MAG: imidazole glycerol phosphate synthase subunit HisF [Myxococcota bacterium]|nr:imidazole glycerol phosphate synthase subunit HisF [Myxococcota bacterium]